MKSWSLWRSGAGIGVWIVGVKIELGRVGVGVKILSVCGATTPQTLRLSVCGAT